MKRKSKRPERLIRLFLQSLPAVLVAVAFVMYGLTFMPLSADKMRKSAALIERVSCYEISSDGHPAAWFRAFGDSLSLNGLTVIAGQDVVESVLLTGCWVNRYDFFPSCRGRILMPNPDTTSFRTLALANKKTAAVIQRAADDTEKLIKQLDKKAARLKYYLSTHSVIDDGYNTMAAYSAALNSRREEAARMDSVLKGLLQKSGLSIRLVVKYTLLHSGADGKTQRTACNDLTEEPQLRFHILQTADQRKPRGAEALYFHRWLSPAALKGDGLLMASYHGSLQVGFSTDSLRQSLFPGTAKADGSHGAPPLFAPDGSPVFTESGRPAGVSVKGAVVKGKSFAFGFNDLLP